MLKRGVGKAPSNQTISSNQQFTNLFQLNILHLQRISLLHQLYPGVQAAEMINLHPKLRLLELFSLRG
jgi:hypothetical protein